MNLELHFIDCTSVQSVVKVFGSKPEYADSEVGSQLNNSLIKEDGKRAIVLLYEFEKNKSEIHNAFLLPFDNGKCP